VPLAEAGHEVVGVDLDPAMLARARTRAADAGATVARRLTWREGDLTTLRLPEAGGFGLAILGLNSLFLLATRKAQAAALATLAAHLRPGGAAVVDIWLPDAEDLSRFDGRLVLEYVRADPETGHLVTKMAAASHDATTQSVILTAIYDEGLPGRSTTRWVRHDRLRLLSADELRALAEAVGLTVEVIAGDYGLSPLSPGSERAILVARRPDG
jgi:SAM-dependent methyltransferase